VTNERTGGRRANHTLVCASAIVAGLVLVALGFLVVGGVIGWVVGGAGVGAVAVGFRGVLTGETPRLF
jgi:hypothetical protein